MNSSDKKLLEPGARLLRGQYEIEKPLSSGGFAITYLARDSLARRVVIKECFPSELCYRDGDEVLPVDPANHATFRRIVGCFVDEARRMAKLDHPNVVGVHQVFEENQTAYMGMDYVEGTELLDVSTDDPDRLSNQLLKKILNDALEGIRYVHERGMLHRDISPDNILLDAEDHLTLIDFGGARERSAQGSDNAVMMSVKEGYSPYEFYIPDSPEGPSSDLYSLAATMYRLIAGEAPPEGLERYELIEDGHNDPYKRLAIGSWPHETGFLDLIDRALSVRQEDRLQSAAEWLEYLDEFTPPSNENGLTYYQARQIAGQAHPTLTGEELQAAICEIVDTFNAAPEDPPIQQAAPEPAAEPAPEPVEPARNVRSEPSKQMVDIFGNPVMNVDQWMREQDRKSRMNKNIRREKEPTDGQSKGRPQKSTLMRLLSSGLSLRGNSSHSIEN